MKTPTANICSRDGLGVDFYNGTWRHLKGTAGQRDCGRRADPIPRPAAERFAASRMAAGEYWYATPDGTWLVKRRQVNGRDRWLVWAPVKGMFTLHLDRDTDPAGDYPTKGTAYRAIRSRWGVD